MQPEQKYCPVCHVPVSDTFYFCPNCGKPLKPKAASSSFLTQFGIYALSIFLPPLGLWPGIKYLRQESGKTKAVGAVAIFLTIVFTFITIWLSMGLITKFSSQYQSLLQGGSL